jgi:hypothetical protein
MMKTIFLSTLLGGIMLTATAQQKSDTVIVELAKTSRIIFTIKDHADLPTLRQYDFQALFTDILYRIESKQPSPLNDTVLSKPTDEPAEVNWDDDDHDHDKEWRYSRTYRNRRTRHSINIDLGLNNYLQNGKFPDETNELYTVRPWGSWYAGITSVQHTPVAKKLFLEWGLGMSWYTFKYENDNVVMSKDDNGVVFFEDLDPLKSYTKSKLSMSFVTAYLIPMLDFGGYGDKTRFWDSGGSKFRFGFGPYAGYRIGSHSKVVYKEDGDKEKDKNKDNFYLENFRYGLRLQLGIRSTDLFFNYDLNELFTTSQPNNPKLNAFSFGIIF